MFGFPTYCHQNGYATTPPDSPPPELADDDEQIQERVVAQAAAQFKARTQKYHTAKRKPVRRLASESPLIERPTAKSNRGAVAVPRVLIAEAGVSVQHVAQIAADVFKLDERSAPAAVNVFTAPLKGPSHEDSFAQFLAKPTTSNSPTLLDSIPPPLPSVGKYVRRATSQREIEIRPSPKVEKVPQPEKPPIPEPEPVPKSDPKDNKTKTGKKSPKKEDKQPLPVRHQPRRSGKIPSTSYYPENQPNTSKRKRNSKKLEIPEPVEEPQPEVKVEVKEEVIEEHEVLVFDDELKGLEEEAVAEMKMQLSITVDGLTNNLIPSVVPPLPKPPVPNPVESPILHNSVLNGSRKRWLPTRTQQADDVKPPVPTEVKVESPEAPKSAEASQPPSAPLSPSQLLCVEFSDESCTSSPLPPPPSPPPLKKPSACSTQHSAGGSQTKAVASFWNEGSQNYIPPDSNIESPILVRRQKVLSLYCKSCDFWFNSKAEMTRHNERHVRAEAAGQVCIPCNQSFLYRREFHSHLSRRHGIKPLGCTKCSKSFTTKPALLQHYADEHFSTKPCLVCGAVFESFPHFVAHRRVCIESQGDSLVAEDDDEVEVVAVVAKAASHSESNGDIDSVRNKKRRIIRKIKEESDVDPVVKDEPQNDLENGLANDMEAVQQTSSDRPVLEGKASENPVESQKETVVNTSSDDCILGIDEESPQGETVSCMMCGVRLEDFEALEQHHKSGTCEALTDEEVGLEEEDAIIGCDVQQESCSDIT